MIEYKNLNHEYHRMLHEPHLILTGIIGLINGYWHKLKFLIMGKHVKIGKMFRVYGKFNIMGSGRVIMGNGCVIQSKLFKSASFLTTNPKALIEIGDNATFNGTTIQCFDRISIGNYCSIADGYIVDSPSHFTSSDRRLLSAKKLPTAPVKIERNVWISTKVVICHGVTIGKNSVVGACSLVRKNIPGDCFYAGIPAQFISSVKSSVESEGEVE